MERVTADPELVKKHLELGTPLPPELPKLIWLMNKVIGDA